MLSFLFGGQITKSLKYLKCVSKSTLKFSGSIQISTHRDSESESPIVLVNVFGVDNKGKSASVQQI